MKGVGYNAQGRWQYLQQVKGGNDTETVEIRYFRENSWYPSRGLSFKLIKTDQIQGCTVQKN